MHQRCKGPTLTALPAALDNEFLVRTRSSSVQEVRVDRGVFYPAAGARRRRIGKVFFAEFSIGHHCDWPVTVVGTSCFGKEARVVSRVAPSYDQRASTATRRCRSSRRRDRKASAPRHLAPGWEDAGVRAAVRRSSAKGYPCNPRLCGQKLLVAPNPPGRASASGAVRRCHEAVTPRSPDRSHVTRLGAGTCE